MAAWWPYLLLVKHILYYYYYFKTIEDSTFAWHTLLGYFVVFMQFHLDGLNFQYSSKWPIRGHIYYQISYLTESHQSSLNLTESHQILPNLTISRKISTYLIKSHQMHQIATNFTITHQISLNLTKEGRTCFFLKKNAIFN